MAKRPVTKRREKAETESIQESIFDALAGAGAASMNGTSRVQESKRETSDPEVTTAALLEQIGALKGEIASMSQTHSALMAQPLVTATVEPPKVVAPEFPDPTVYPVEYARAVAEYTVALQRREYETQKRENAQRVEQTNKYDTLFEDFAEAYPELAEDEDRMQFAATKAVNDAKKRGLDPDKYMFTNSARFFKDVARQYETVFGKDEAQDEPEREERDDNSRSASIFGGLERGPRGKPSTPPAGDMIKDLQDVQRKLGIF